MAAQQDGCKPVPASVAQRRWYTSQDGAHLPAPNCGPVRIAALKGGVMGMGDIKVAVFLRTASFVEAATTEGDLRTTSSPQPFILQICVCTGKGRGLVVSQAVGVGELLLVSTPLGACNTGVWCCGSRPKLVLAHTCGCGDNHQSPHPHPALILLN